MYLSLRLLLWFLTQFEPTKHFSMTSDSESDEEFRAPVPAPRPMASRDELMKVSRSQITCSNYCSLVIWYM